MSTVTPTLGGPFFSATRHASSSKIIVRATGSNPTGGFHPVLKVDPTFVEPPIVDFENPAPTGIVNDLVTPYDVTLELSYPHKEEIVTVTYKSKSHKVVIKKV